jgi:hypothetical protein
MGVRGAGSYWRRLAILLGLVTSDLVCFAAADAALRMVTTPPALALFRNRSLGQPNTVIDLVMIIALIFVGARYLVGDYSRRQLFWDGARSTTTALFICGIAYCAAVSSAGAWQVMAGILVWLSLIFSLPTARQAMRLFLGGLGHGICPPPSSAPARWRRRWCRCWASSWRWASSCNGWCRRPRRNIFPAPLPG